MVKLFRLKERDFNYIRKMRRVDSALLEVDHLKRNLRKRISIEKDLEVEVEIETENLSNGY